MPIELPGDEEAGDVAGALVTSGDEPAVGVLAAGTFSRESAAPAGGGAGVPASAPAAGVPAGSGVSPLCGWAAGLIEASKSAFVFKMIEGAVVFAGSSSEGAPMVAAGTVSA